MQLSKCEVIQILMHTNDYLFLLRPGNSSCSRSSLSLPDRGQVLIRCSHTVTGLGTLFLFLQFLDLLWNFLVPFTPYSDCISKSLVIASDQIISKIYLTEDINKRQNTRQRFQHGRKIMCSIFIAFLFFLVKQ